MTFVPEARALVTEAGAAVSGPARLSRVRGEVLCRALSCPHRPSSHTALSVRSYVPPTSQGIVCSKVYSVITVWTVARRAPLSTGFSRQEYWSGLPIPSPGDLPEPGRLFTTEPPGEPSESLCCTPETNSTLQINYTAVLEKI